MTSRKQKKQMLDYLVDRLAGTEKVNPQSKEVILGIQSSYIFVGEDGIVLLVDQVYSNNSFNSLFAKAKSERKKVAAVVLKDGQTFFRSAAEANYFKKSHQLSLKNYNADEMHRMMLLRPEERFLSSRGWVQYYQPDSARLSAGIVSFKFTPVVFDYSHIDQSVQFKPQDRESERLHIWTQKQEFSGKLNLGENYVIDRK